MSDMEQIRSGCEAHLCLWDEEINPDSREKCDAAKQPANIHRYGIYQVRDAKSDNKGRNDAMNRQSCAIRHGK